MEDWTAIAADAAQGIAEVGYSAILIKNGGRSGPSHNPIIAAGTSHACTVLEKKISQYERANTNISASERKFLVSTEGLTVAPETQDKLQIDGKDLSIVQVQPLQPGGVVVLWEVMARGS